MSFYPNGVRYISDKDNEGLETYNKETNETIDSEIRKYIGQLYFTINDLTFRENFVLSQDPEEEELSPRDLCTECNVSPQWENCVEEGCATVRMQGVPPKRLRSLPSPQSPG